MAEKGLGADRRVSDTEDQIATGRCTPYFETKHIFEYLLNRGKIIYSRNAAPTQRQVPADCLIMRNSFVLHASEMRPARASSPHCDFGPDSTSSLIQACSVGYSGLYGIKGETDEAGLLQNSNSSSASRSAAKEFVARKNFMRDK